MTVTECRVGEPLPDDLFDIPLSEGTWVSNYITDETYIVQKGGVRRDVRPGEFTGTNFEELLHSQPEGRNRRRLLIAIATIVTLGIVTLIFLYYRRSTRPQLPGS
jgi:hypothetical protein